MIGLGATIVDQYHWVLYIFAAFLILTGIKMLFVADKEHKIEENGLIRFLKRRMHVTDEIKGHAFFVRKPHPETGRLMRYATPLFLALIMIEIADLVFAVDSVPAVFTITTDPYIVYTSNIFAILGLRALYFALAAILHRFAYLKYALSVLLVFIGSKIFVADLTGWEKFPPAWSLGITFAILGAGVAFSLWKTGKVSASPKPVAAGSVSTLTQPAAAMDGVVKRPSILLLARRPPPRRVGSPMCCGTSRAGSDRASHSAIWCPGFATGASRC